MNVLIAGDFVPIHRTAELIEKGDFRCFEKIKPIVKDADYSILNFECPVVEGHAKPITKVGPNLKCTRSSVDAIKWAGFKGVTLANNHFRDYGDVGVRDTIGSLKENGIDYVGGGTCEDEARKVLYKEVEGQTLAVVNCCEHEFSIATSNSGGGNALNLVKQYNDIVDARKKADYVLLIVHGGHENYQLPSPRMQETYRFFIDVGADAVVNHHQHCFSGYEVYKGKPIFYGLGNLCFEQLFEKTANAWYEGYMVRIELNPQSVNYSIIPYRQGEDSLMVVPIDKDAYDERIAELNKIIAVPDLLQASFNKLCEQRGKDALISTFAATGNRYVLGLMRRHLLPTFITKNKLLKAFPFVNCESHRDILFEMLNLNNMII